MQKLARLLAASAVLATVALSAAGTAWAEEKQGYHPKLIPAGSDKIEGPVRPDKTWTQEKISFIKSDNGETGSVKVRITDSVDGGICAQLRDFRGNTNLSDEKCWRGDDMQTLVDKMPDKTPFFLYLRKIGDGSDNDYRGIIYY